MTRQHIHIVRHPLLGSSLTVLRQKNTGTEDFRKHAGIVSKILLVEALKNLRVSRYRIETPLSAAIGVKLKDDVVVVPVLRAGLAMLFAINDFLPQVGVGFVGLERDEQTAIAREYYRKLPRLFKTSTVLVLDPMLATGGSFDDTITILKGKGASKLLLVCIVAAPEGLERIRRKHPGVTVYTAAIDSHLNDRKFIVPGLGDFGDRYFGTV
ncbi:uracil phosphoribosyltransferase [Candidatus Gottesmanbacteria bacterium RBG_16_52_11]|uniref:Uracil phosphoribosyltransferase n=1 Tax=Candidatus Gottesmanbacteria bacterium RBG_16_52_11 TaxID=1798374 RepID=A0A1F5YW76_9BACT|nr:MAG: uracil phosphoribosyltransferase [Candidatus Gottesmanbacteria bacterium RBG_16_52_11]